MTMPVLDQVLQLHEAATKGDVAALRRLLAETDDVDARDEQGNTALILAAKAKQREAVSALLSHGADVNAMSDKGSTAISWAADRGDAGTLKILLEPGGDPNLRKLGDYYNDMPALHLAAERDSTDCVQLLLDYGAEIDLRDTQLGRTALLAALDTDISPNAAALLIRRGADVNARDKHGFTPLKEAITYDCLEIAELLRQAGAME
ncbi:MAG: ankyrin repeat domain-containing protein [Armatimonadetes bacterium]|nr:ankyrin repeat domain-containing protein [Armatimonadota bacterium]